MKVVVSNTSPAVALAHMDLFHLMPKVFEKIFLPMNELPEWEVVLSRHGHDRALALVDEWKSGDFLVLKALSAAQSRRAELLAERIHPGEPHAGLIDGASIALARTLQDLGLIDGLWADERVLREVAHQEGIERIHGSLWFLETAMNRGLLTQDVALEAPDKAAERGYHYSSTLMKQYRQRILGR